MSKDEAVALFKSLFAQLPPGLVVPIEALATVAQYAWGPKPALAFLSTFAPNGCPCGTEACTGRFIMAVHECVKYMSERNAAKAAPVPETVH